MNNKTSIIQPDREVMLVIAGHDPTGGAGIQADIESAAALGVHAITIISCLTVQDSHNVQTLEPVAPTLIQRQLDTLLADISADACKLGLLGTVETVELVADLMDRPGFPVTVFDPILAAGGGTELTDSSLERAIKQRLMPRLTLLTPNLPEAQRLSGQLAPEACAAELIRLGCDHVLITGGHNAETEVINRLYDPTGVIGEWAWPRLSHGYHGSGCTLSSAITALLAKGVEMEPAVAQAQKLTWNSLLSAYTLSDGQRIPNRLNH